jgi:ferric-dicitrate binding protein FerR (iron transport regulator)
VEVLGTHFNINSYSNEEVIKTTLLEGRVRVHSSTSNAEAVLNPGEQAVLKRTQDNRIVVDKDVDVDAEVAWRFGFFNFNNADLKTMMRQLVRWYDVEVVYQGEVSDIKFIGEIPRELSLSQVLSGLQRPEVKFKMEGKTIIVTP